MVEEPRLAARWLKAGAAFVWLTTALLVLHPGYRAIGAGYLGRLGVPEWLMPATCVFELGLGLRVLLGPATWWLTLLQVGAMAVFTALLTWVDPWLLVSPFGFLTKNVPLAVALYVAYRLERGGWTRGVEWALRGGMAIIWVTEGLFPKVLFQQAPELAMAARVFPAVPSSWVLYAMGAAQVASGLLALGLPLLATRRGALRALLFAQLAALLALPIVAGALEPSLFVHPFGPLTKNAPLLAGHYLLLRRCSSSS